MNGNSAQTATASTSDTVNYGVTAQGFIVKPFQAILNDAFTRAQQLFGPDIDLRSSSTLRKVIELGCLDSALLWMALDDVYHSGFTSTASGGALDLLGADWAWTAPACKRQARRRSNWPRPLPRTASSRYLPGLWWRPPHPALCSFA